MDWHSIPPMRLEARFGDRVVPAFGERPKSLWAMIADAVAQNPDGEALVCGDRRMNWREVAQQSAAIATGLQVIFDRFTHLFALRIVTGGCKFLKAVLQPVDVGLDRLLAGLM